MKIKFKSDDLIVCIAGLSALYTCFLAGRYWDSLLKETWVIDWLTTNHQGALIYFCFYASLVSSVLIILFERVAVLKLIAFFSSFGLAAFLTLAYGYRDWFIHPIVMFNLIFFNHDERAPHLNFKNFNYSIFMSVSLSTVAVFLIHFLRGLHPLHPLMYAAREIIYFDIRPGFAMRMLSLMSSKVQLLSAMIFLLIITLPLSLKSKRLSTIYFVLSIGFWTLHRRYVGDDMLAWILFILPLLLISIEVKESSNDQRSF